MTRGLEIRPFHENDEPAVVRLWAECGLVRPWNDPKRDVQRKLRLQRELFLVGCLDDRVIASVMAGYEGHRGWVNYLAVDPAYRRRGYARTMMEYVERKLDDLGCPKINLQIRGDNLEATAFYRALGFLEDDVLSFGKRLDPDGPRPGRHA